jgi:transcriptional regulator with XRE-family HTH domain
MRIARRTTVLDGPDPIDVEVGARVRVRRRWMGLSQQELADAAGRTCQQVQKYERGANRISASMLVKIAKILETTVASLVGEYRQEPNESVTYVQVATPGALELLAAYWQIRGPNARRAFVLLAKELAKTGLAKRRVRPARAKERL